MSSTKSDSSSPTPAASQQPQERKKIELISQALKSTNGVGNGKVDPAEAVRANSGEEASTSKPERRPDGAPPGEVRPALELDDDDDQGDPGDRQKRQRRALQDIAEEAGVPLKRIYDAVVDLGMEGEEPVTVGTLKDHYRQTRAFQQEKDTFEHERDSVQTEILSARSQVQGVVDRIVSVVGQEVFDRVLGEVRQDVATKLQHSKAQLMEWYPHWSDANAMARDRTRIEEVLKTYGYSRHDVASIQDARVVKFILDSIKVRDRYDRLKAGTVERQPTTAPPSTKKQRTSTWDEVQAIAKGGDKTRAIDKLLGI